MIKKHKKYIQRTFYLAKKGLGKVFPNPLVGCVIVKNNKIIGEGYHKKYGDNHHFLKTTLTNEIFFLKYIYHKID